MTGHYAVFPDSDEGEGGEGVEPWSFAQPEKAPGAPLRTTPALQGLMAEVEEMLQQTPGRIALQPALAVEYGRFSLQLWVTDGASRYAVKSISQLARHVAEGATYAYGKKLAFAHGLAAFDERSQALLRWLLAALEEGASLEDPFGQSGDDEAELPGPAGRRWHGGADLWGAGFGDARASAFGQKRSAAARGPQRTMALSPQQLVEFLKTQIGESLQLNCEDYSRSRCGVVEVRRGAPAQEQLLEVREVEGGFEVSALWEFSGVVAPGGCALLVDDGFYVTDPGFAPVGRLLHALQDAGGQLRVSREDAPLFGATFLPALQRELGLNPPDALLRYRPQPLQLQFSFDVIDGAIQVDAQALYGQRAIALAISPASLPGVMEQAPDGQPIVVGIADEPPALRQCNFYRQKAAEARALQLLLAYFPPTGVLPLAADGPAASLLFDGLAQFRQMGEVFTTPAFNRLIRPRPPRVQLGLSLAGNLIALDMAADDVPLPELFALMDSYRRRRSFHRLSDGTFASLRNFDDHGLSRLMADMGISAEDVREGRVELPTYQAFYLESQLDGVYRSEVFAKFVQQLRQPDPAQLAPVPAALAEVLRPYQVEGFRWLQTLRAMGFGGILADEMGLGKTLQVIALLLSMYSEGEESAPTSNPAGEPPAPDGAASAPTDSAAPAPDGAAAPAACAAAPAAPAAPNGAANATPCRSPLRRAEILSLPIQLDGVCGPGAPTLVVCPASLVYNWTAELARFAPQLQVAAVAGIPAQRQTARNQPGVQVLVTSYDSLRTDAKAWEALPLRAAILDEAHYIKNHATKTTRAVKRLQASWRLALTGTPVENRPAELWSIFDFLMPGFLGTAMRFRERFEAPIIGGDETAAQRLAALVGPFVLRRLKRDVLPELPPKLETTLEVPLQGEQRKLYFAAEQSLRERLNLQKNTAKARRYGYPVKGLDGGEFKTVEVLAELTRLRQIALDPALVFENYRGVGAKRGAILERIGAAMDAGQKTLVFSQFTSFLDLLAQDLRAQGVPFFSITGATPKRQRLQLVEQFNCGDVPVFLVSLRAGGVGLNLTGASQVIHADPWWNSSAQSQASDRAHRFGQQEVVSVCNVVAAGTIEARMMQLQEMKAQLADLLVGAANGEALGTLTPELLADLLDN
ncbi:superfamily II DNA or RNA helicase [Parvibacter caecicola]|uniref:Superfamily II DNA or RNA helicase n=2 Tax=Parvibacter caecicola TaxID=747645 RepID=A0A7W5D384_9ACTN|nr:DEAD/DEAH box helicase [Parvibacter caecicola]MBB3172114.1 superfamily II DNA or RNA helicase [Parvibacter caecicola]MCR2041046.1 SNF2 family helicase [Parvibacter caecicola]